MEVAYLKISYAQGRKICLAVALQLPAELVAELQPTKLLLGTSTIKHYIDRSMHGLCHAQRYNPDPNIIAGLL